MGGPEAAEQGEETSASQSVAAPLLTVCLLLVTHALLVEPR